MTRTGVLIAALLLLGACASERTDMPSSIAMSWCERHMPGEAACVEGASEAHRHCMTGSGPYDACRAQAVAGRQTAGQ